MTDSQNIVLASQLQDYTLDSEEQKMVNRFYDGGVIFLEFIMTKRGITREDGAYKKLLDFYNSSFLTLARGIFALVKEHK